jgi:hypothetical protein
MSEVQFITHKGRQILLMDFTVVRSTSELKTSIEEIKKFVALHRQHSLLVLADFTGLKIDGERTRIVKDMAGHNRPYIRFIALVGLGPIRSMAFRIMLRLTGKSNHKVFGNRNKGLDWLTEK